MDSDIYSEEIKFNFKGKERVSSLAGAIITILVKLLVITFIITLVLSLVAGQTQVIKATEERIEFNENFKVESFGELKYDFVLGLTTPVDKTFVTFIAKLDSYENGKFVDTQEVPMIPCPIDHESVEVIDREMQTTWPAYTYADAKYQLVCPSNLDSIRL